MPGRRFRNDLSNLVSWLLLASASTAVATGVVAHAWDLNGFRLHTWAGYAMAVAALAHVALSWRRLVAYSRFRAGHVRTALGASVADRWSRRGARGRAGRDRGRSARPGAVATRAATREPTHPDATAAARRPTVAAAAVSRRSVLGIGAIGATGFAAGRGLRQPPAIPHGSDIGLLYHEWSKPGIIDALGTLTDWGGRPEQYKAYPDAPTAALPPPAGGGEVSVATALQQRTSTREYAPGALDAATFSRLLRSAVGLQEGSDRRRTAPSSGALYPLEVYALVNDVDGVPAGVHHYDVRSHGLTLLRRADVAARVQRIGLDQDFLAAAQAVLAVTLVPQRMRFRYRDRSYRYGLLEAGHLGQNVYLAATALGLGACAVGAFRDDDLNDLLGVDGVEEAAVYLLAVGRPAA